MDSARIVRLRTTADGGQPYRFGSGYLVGPGLVLTAAHVLRLPGGASPPSKTGDRCEVRLGVRDQAWCEGRVLHCDPARDLAAVRVPGLDAADTPVRFAVLGDNEPIARWRATGFPVAALDPEPDSDREFEAAYGTLATQTGLNDGTLGLTVTSRLPLPTAKGSGWAGLSGAAVFVDGRLVGVVTQVPDAFDRSLTARRLDPVLDAGLLRALGSPPLETPSGYADHWASHKAYLERDMRYLPAAGIPLRRDLPFDEGYVRLEAIPDEAEQLRPSAEGDTEGDSAVGDTAADAISAVRTLGEQFWSRVHEPRRPADEQRAMRTPEDVVREASAGGRSAVILGVPGAGKSTALRAAARALANDRGGPVPLIARLVDLERHDSILELLVHDATRHLSRQEREARRTALDAAIAQQRVCLLLDGLDEVGADIGRVRQELQSLAGAGLSVIVTSRPTHFQFLGGFELHKILPLLARDATAFVSRWFRMLARDRTMTEEERDAWVETRSAWLRDQLQDRPQLRDLAANPLMLTFLAILAGDDSRVGLPQYRWQLYREYEEELLVTREEQRGRKAPGAALTMQSLHEIARLLHEGYYSADEGDGSEDVGGSRSQRPVRRTVLDALASVLSVRHGLGSTAADRAAAILGFWEEAGLLQRTARFDGDEWYLFTHQTFQEYGTARALADTYAGDLAGLWAHLRPHIRSGGWSEVIPLTLGCLAESTPGVGTVDVTWLVAAMWHEAAEVGEERACLYMVARCIAEGATITNDWLSFVLGSLQRRALDDPVDASPGSREPVYRRAEESFRALASIGWSRPNQVMPYLEAVMNADVEPARRTRAAETVGKLGSSHRRQAQGVLRELACDRSIEPTWRVISAWSLARLGRADESVGLIRRLLTSLRGQSLSAQDGPPALSALEEIGNAAAVRLLTEIAEQLTYGPDYRLRAAKALDHLGHRKISDQLLRAMVLDSRTPFEFRVKAREELRETDTHRAPEEGSP